MAGEPVPLSDRAFLLPGPVNMFLFREGRACVALDTGLTADAGHSINQFAFQVDDVFLATDALFGEEALARHRLVYRYDPKKHRETLDLLGGFEARITAYSHGAPTSNGQALREANRANLEATREVTLGSLGSPGSAEEVAARATATLGLEPTLEGYYLNFSTIKGHLAALRAEGLASFRLEQGRLLWERR